MRSWWVLLALAGCATGPTPGVVTDLGGDADRFGAIEREAYAENALLRFEAAETAYRETALIASQDFAGDPLGAAEQELHLALNKSNLGQYAQAAAIFSSARGVISAQGRPLLRAKAEVFWAMHLLNQGQRSAASTAAGRALAIASRQDVASAAPSAARVVADFQITPEEARLLEQGASPDLGLGVGTLTEAQQLAILQAQAYYVQAAAARSAGRPAAALTERAEAALSGVPATAIVWLRAEIAGARARDLAAAGDLAGAVAQARASLALTRRYAADARPEALGHLRLGNILLQAGQPGAARGAFRDGVRILSDGGRGVAMSQLSGYLGLLADNPGLDPSGSEGFLALQQLRSPVTSETLARVAARLSTGSSERAQAIRAFEDSERAVNILTSRLDLLTSQTPRNPAAISVARSQLREAQAALTAATRSRDRLAPNFNQIVNSSVPLATVRAALRGDETFVLTRLGPSEGFVAAVSARGFRLARIQGGARSVDARVGRIRTSIYDPNFDVGSARELHQLVLGPVADLVGRNSLIMALDGSLLSMPPGLYIAEEPTGYTPGTFDFSSIQWLGTRQPVSVTMSPGSFVALRRAAPSSAPAAFQGFADYVPYGAGNAGVVLARRELPAACRPIKAAIGELPPLPGSAIEVAALRDLVGAGSSRLITGSSFTDAGLPADLGRYRVLHFATQGLLPISQECIPEPALTTSLGAGTSDGLIEASEVVELQLDADLVVLSACDTGGAAGTAASVAGLREPGGEALSGLVRSFFFSGARNVVASHWLVPDAETVDLMIGFYAGMKEGATPARAMQAARAQLAGTPDTSHPYFWSAFSVIGDGGRPVRL